MKLSGCILAFVISVSIAYNQNVLEYSLQIINHLASEHIGPFECIFYDISTVGFFEEILEDLAKSPKLQHVVKLVVRGAIRSEHKHLPYNPPLILITPGSDEAMSGNENRVNIAKVLTMFSQIAKVLVFVDFDSYNEHLMQTLVVWTKFNNAVFVDKRSGRLRLSSLKHYGACPGWPHPRNLFDWHKSELRGGIITASKGPTESIGAPSAWLRATVDFLNSRLVWYRGPTPSKADISLQTYSLWGTPLKKRFQSFFITHISKGRILVPKGRPVNALELMIMPFNWQAWMLLLILMILAEAVKRYMPTQLRNDPILLVVCGFERHSLHQAGRWEKIIFFSLIVIMFFMTNAFESKIVSWMVDKPLIQPIKYVEDFDKHGIKIMADLQRTPEAVNHSLIGKYVVHGVRQLWETLPGVAMYVSQEVADMAPRFSFNFERGEPWFDVLEGEFLTEIPMYGMAFRTPLLEVFRFTYMIFVESGLMELNKWRFHYEEYCIVWGRRPRKSKENEIYLKFGDMLLAWIVLGFGFGVSFSVFVGEIAGRKLGKYFIKI